MNENLSIITTLIVTGFLGSLGHCLGMCGPLVMMVGVQSARSSRGNTLPVHLLYHSARIGMYGVLGGIVGAVGSLIGVGSHFNDVAGVISLLLGAGVILFSLSYLGWLPFGRLENTGSWLTRRMGQALRQGGVRGVMFLGALNGLLPCGLVYSALLSAAATGSVIWGTVAMLLFGTATIPALLVAGMGAHLLSIRLRQSLLRLAGVMILLIGVQLVLRGMAAFNLLPHLRVGEIVIW
ncbi:MAG: sulfite exporter TauE/SafE family protein [Anaerolineaceae bacterium]|nr:sulfite exporter TauE/SafE family protein [Anaerolineaceae bacterium]